MKRKFELSIPKPCHEKWEEFNPTRIGGYCSQCQKEVVDFTKWDDDRIKSYFATPANVTCGRFSVRQLRTYHVEQTKKPWLPLAWLSASLLFFQPDAMAQKETPAKKERVDRVPWNSDNTDDDGIRNPERMISGRIFSASDSLPLPGANVIVKDTTIGTVSDAEGKFELDIPYSDCSQDTLVFSLLGFQTIERGVSALGNGEILLPEDFRMTVGEVMLGGITVRRWTPRGIWWRIKNLFR